MVPSNSIADVRVPGNTGSSSVYRFETAWGFTQIEWSGAAVVRIAPPMDGDADREEGLPIDEAPAPVRELAARLQEYFAGEDIGEIVDAATLAAWLDAAGITGARRAMSLALHDVPRGVTLAYGELAMLAGSPGAARAAGSACARNQLPIVIPCHRVVHAGARKGDVGSYGPATGSAYKRRLLELEDAALVRAHS